MNLTTDNIIDLLAIGTSLLNIFVIIGLAWLGYKWGFKNWLKQKREESKIQERQRYYESKIEACKAAWGLLGYCFDVPNEKTFIIFEMEGRDKKYFFLPLKAEVFINDFEKFFFEESHSLFWIKR